MKNEQENYIFWVKWAENKKTISGHRPIYKYDDDLYIDLSVGNVTFYKNLQNKHQWHRLDGPAFINWNGVKSYWIDNNHIYECDYWVHPAVVQYFKKRAIRNVIVEVLNE